MRFDSRQKVGPVRTEIETIDGRRVPLKVIVNPRARHVSVRIDPTRREAIATAPSKRYLKHAEQFAAERAGWIAQELSRLPQGVQLAPGARVTLRGRRVLLRPRQTPRSSSRGCCASSRKRRGTI
jgi:predicted metal-dependent hydrolase